MFNSAAPDDGNMMVLEQAATPEQKERWLAPIVSGAVRSSFAMTEPHPGGGSDPGMMLTNRHENGATAMSSAGRKWFITGAADAAHFILVARTSDDPRRGLTAFLHHRDDPELAHRPAYPDHGARGTRRALRTGLRGHGAARRPGDPRRGAGPQDHADAGWGT